MTTKDVNQGLLIDVNKMLFMKFGMHL